MNRGLLRRWLTMESLAPRDRRAVWLGLGVLAPALLWVTVVRPYRDVLVETKQRVAAERELLQRELALIEGRAQLPAALAAARSGAQREEARLLVAANVTSAEARLTELLEQLAGLSRVLLKEVRSVPLGREQKAPDGMQLLRVAVQGESDLAGTVTYLHRIEHSPYLLRIHELNVENAPPPRAEPARGRNSRPTRQPQIGVMQFTVVVEAFTPVSATVTEGRK